MKKVLLFAAAALMFAPAAGAQTIVTPFKIDKNALLKEVERSDKTLENEKRAVRGQTWLDRGDVFYKISAVVPSQIYGGMNLKDLLAIIGKDYKTSEETLQSGTEYKVISIPEVDIYLLNDVVQFWNEKVVIYEGAPDKAFEAYKKAAELDSKLAPKVKEGLIRLSDIYKMRANTHYNLNETEKAADEYLAAYNVQKDPLVGVIDTNSVYNAAYIHLANKDYEKAIAVYEDAIAHDVWADGNIAYYLSWAYLQEGESYYPKAKDILQRGFKLYPDNANIIEGLINYYYMTGGDFDEITPVLERAIEKDPSKLIYWSGLGQAYINSDDTDRNIEFYTRFAKQFPDDFTANYYLGDQLMEKGHKILRDAEDNASLSQAQRDESKAKALEVFKRALPPLMKAYDDKPSEKAVIQRIVRVLFQLKDEPGMMAEFEKFYDLEKSMDE